MRSGPIAGADASPRTHAAALAPRLRPVGQQRRARPAGLGPGRGRRRRRGRQPGGGVGAGARALPLSSCSTPTTRRSGGAGPDVERVGSWPPSGPRGRRAVRARVAVSDARAVGVGGAGGAVADRGASRLDGVGDHRPPQRRPPNRSLLRARGRGCCAESATEWCVSSTARDERAFSPAVMPGAGPLRALRCCRRPEHRWRRSSLRAMRYERPRVCGLRVAAAQSTSTRRDPGRGGARRRSPVGRCGEVTARRRRCPPTPTVVLGHRGRPSPGRPGRRRRVPRHRPGVAGTPLPRRRGGLGVTRPGRLDSWVAAARAAPSSCRRGSRRTRP